MAEPALDSLLQHLYDIQPRRAAEDSDGRLAGLGDVEEVVQQGLPWMCGKQVELINYEDNGLRRDSCISTQDLRWMR
jgi:hypothetical protein